MASKNSQDRSNSSMQLTRAADYAVRVMVHLAALPRDVREMLPALANATGAPVSFLSKVLQALARANLIWSQRGVSGGFAISDLGRESSMLEVIEAIDGPIHLNVCTTHGQPCPRKAWCPAHPVWARAQQALLKILQEATIADLATEQAVLFPQNGERRHARNHPTCIHQPKRTSMRGL